MPEISMCMNSKCEKRATCYRYIATPNEYMQSYIKPKASDCRHYWKADKASDEKLKEIDGSNMKNL